MTYSAILHEEILRPDATLPVQFEQIWHGHGVVTPEHALMISVLWQAADDLQKHRYATKRKRQRLYREAYRWIISNDRTWLFSFLSICDVLNLSPQCLRARLLLESRAAAEQAA